MIAPNGAAVYALPSHQEFLVKRAMEMHNWTREELMDACPPEYYADFMNWLIPLSGGWIPVWPIGILNYPLTRPQVALLRSSKWLGCIMAISRFPRKRLQGRNCDGVAENKICFSDKEAAYIQATLQHREGVPIQIEKELSGFWFHRTNWESDCG